MKNLIKYGFMATLMGAMLFFTGCGDDDEVIVTDVISVSLAGADINQSSFYQGEDIDLTITYVTEGGLSGFNWTPTVNGTTGTKEFISPSALASDLGVDASTLEFGSTIALEMGTDYAFGATVSFEFEVVDLAGETATVNFDFTISSESAISSYSAFLLAAPTGDNNSDTFFSTNTGVIWTMADVLGTSSPVSADIDFGYYYGTSNEASLTSISAYPLTDYGQAGWGTKNATTFRTTNMETEAFDAVQDGQGALVAAEYEVGGSVSELATNLTAGDVIAFKTDASKDGGSKFGLIKVVSITATSGSDGRIEIEVIVED